MSVSEQAYPVPTLIYHFTHAKNLPEILQSGHVFCQTRLPSGARDVDISYYEVQERRRKKQVSCGPRGNLHDYVPFYFAPRSPMMFAISKGNVEGYEGGTVPLIYLVSSAQRVQNAGLEFVFTDGHPTKAFTSFFDDVAYLSEVPWDVMRSRYWNDDEDHPDRRRRRQAEFLVYGSFPWSAVEFLAVANKGIQTRLQKFLTTKYPNRVKPVRVAPDWYFH